jgi:hypothetical protein
VLETWDGLEVIVAVGRDEGARDGPQGEESVVHNVLGEVEK